MADTDDTDDSPGVGENCARPTCVYCVVREHEAPLCPRCARQQKHGRRVM